jgi:hypothetical protein
MNHKVNPLFKAVLLAGMALFMHACAGSGLFAKPDGMIRMHDELTSVRAELEEMQTKMDLQSARIDALTTFIEKQPTLMNEAMEQNARSFEWLAQIIREKQVQARWMSENNDHPTTVPQSEHASTDKLLVGETEKLWLVPPGRMFHARIDTGATTSSIDARDIESFERDGRRWVRFKIADPDKDVLYAVEKPVARYVRIMQASTSETDRRPVVKLQLQLGRIKVIEEFTLVDRQHLDYQVLIGRNVLRDLMIVDVSRQFIVPLPESIDSGNGNS